MSKPPNINYAHAIITVHYKLEGMAKARRATMRMYLESLETKALEPRLIMMHPEAPMRESITLTGYRRKAGK